MLGPIPIFLELASCEDWELVAELDAKAIIADLRGYGRVAEYYRRESRNLKAYLVLCGK